MGFIRSVLLLAGVVCAVSFAYFFGHGLSVGHGRPYAIGGIMLAIGALLLTVYHKTGPSHGGSDSRS